VSGSLRAKRFAMTLEVKDNSEGHQETIVDNFVNFDYFERSDNFEENDYF